MRLTWLPFLLAFILTVLAASSGLREFHVQRDRQLVLQRSDAENHFRQFEDILERRELLARVAVATFEPGRKDDFEVLVHFGPRISALVPAVNSIVWAPKLSSSELSSAMTGLGRDAPLLPPPPMRSSSIDSGPGLFAVLDIFPRTEANLSSRGLLLNAAAVPASAIAQALTRNDVQATAPLQLVQLPDVAAFVLYGPVYAAPGELLGVLGFSFRFDELFGSTQPQPSVSVRIRDADANAFGLVWKSGPDVEGPSYVRTLAFAGRSFEISLGFATNPDSLARENALLYFTVVLLGALGISALAHALIRFNRSLESSLSAQRANSRQLRMLVGELNHRIGNILGLAGSLARQSFKQGRPVSESLRMYEARIGILARASALAVDGGGTGSLFALMRDAGELFNHRFIVEGPDVAIGPETGQLLSLAIHELATNSVKHGALSTTDGKVHVNWQIKGDSFVLQWDETIELEVEPLEKRRGFGTKLLLDLLPYQLDGKAERVLRDGQFFYRLEAPLQRLML